MFQQIFNPNNLFFRTCDKIFDVVVLSVLWAVLCLPVVTAGPATAALYYTVVKCIRRGEAGTYRNFFHAFKENFKVGAVSGVVAAGAGALLWLGWSVVNAATAGVAGGAAMRAAYTVVLVIPLGVGVFLFPALSRFDFGVGGLFVTSLKLAVKHLPSTVALALLHVEVVQVTLQTLFPLTFAPALTALISSFLLERIFKKYTPAPREDERDEESPWYLK